MRKKELEILLEALLDHPSPSPALEQYTTPAAVASDVLHTARMSGDIEGRRVLDLGCGMGVFTIGAALLGASKVVGVDIDPLSIHTAHINLRRVPADLPGVAFILGDASSTPLPEFDTVIMNPPFGAQRRGADRPFLERASQLSGTVYTIANAPSRSFTISFMQRRGFQMVGEKKYIMPLRYRFRFHTREKAEIESLLLIFKRR